MKLLPLTIVLLLVAALLSADQVVSTMDGRQVLLRDDGTWQYTQQPELIAHFKGAGTKETDSFKISKKPWRLKWKSEGPMFSFFVKSDAGELVASVSGNEDQSTVRQTGDFYLSIMAIGPYEIWILQ